ncbi:MAG: UDP-N-acetylmuramoyl-L-alanine--D-glutamate ligase [Pseudomonadota bacterium]
MITIPGMKKKSVGVFGLGVSGLATCDALAASGASVYSFDESAAAREKTKGTEYRAEHPKDWPWKELEAIVVSPGVPLTHPAPHAIVKKARIEKKPVIGDTELFAFAVNALPEGARPKVIGVTGSNGKSTTTALIGHMLKEAGEDVSVGGNIGEAVLSLPEPAKGRTYVLELSSFQLDLTFSLRLDAAVFLNLSPDHIDRHGSIEGYYKAKKRIFRNQTKDDAAIVGVDDAFGERLCTELLAGGAPDVIPVSAQATLGRGVYVLDGAVYVNLDGKTARAGSLEGAHALRGVHNHQNAAAAIAAASRAGVSPPIALKAAERFTSLPHRMEEIARIGKTVFVNDSKATNAAAAARSLSAFTDIFWIVGGRPKEGGLADLEDTLGGVRKAYLIGEAADDFAKQLKGKVETEKCGALEKAVAAARRDAAASDASAPVVLLSPACASYDQFKNFEVRGEAFRAAVDDLQKADGEAA